MNDLEKQAVELILVEYHDNSATHRMENIINTDLKVKLTQKDDKAVKSLPLAIHLKKDQVIELTLMHKCGIITVLPFSK